MTTRNPSATSSLRFRLWAPALLADRPQENVHEAHLLRLDSSKAAPPLAWRPRWTLDQALANTVNWYRGVLNQNPRPAAQMQPARSSTFARSSLHLDEKLCRGTARLANTYSRRVTASAPPPVTGVINGSEFQLNHAEKSQPSFPREQIRELVTSITRSLTRRRSTAESRRQSPGAVYDAEDYPARPSTPRSTSGLPDDSSPEQSTREFAGSSEVRRSAPRSNPLIGNLVALSVLTFLHAWASADCSWRLKVITVRCRFPPPQSHHPEQSRPSS